MPLNKKRKLNSDAEPGIARSYLNKSFNTIPDGDDHVLNGHVLYLYLMNESSVSKTDHAVKDTFTEKETSSIPLLKNKIQSLVNKTLKKYKKLTNESELNKLKDCCNERFSTEVVCRMNTDSRPTFPQSNSASSQRKCTNCVKLRGHLYKSMLQRKEMKEKHLAEIEQFRRKLSKKNAVRVLNQKIKRKENRIKKLDSDTEDTLQKYKYKLKQLQKKCRKLENTLSEKTKSMLNESVMEVSELKDKLNEKDEEIVFLENDRAVLEEQIESRTSTTPSHFFKKEGKMYSLSTRLFVFDAIMNQVPTANVPKLFAKFVERTGAKLDQLPSRTTVEMMVREMGVITQLQTAECILANPNSTLGFDATTQEGVHVNSVHVTFKLNAQGCLVIAINHLPGGTAEDYAQHIISSIDELAMVFSSFHNKDYQECCKKLTSNISNTMTDRCTSNHAAIQLINAAWNKTLNELNCHLHPLDTVATTVRSALKSLEQNKGKLFGQDCLAANIVLQMNKVRFKDGKGDPMGFKLFLEENNLGKGFIPRYRGNRLHVLFHISGKYFVHHSKFHTFLKSGSALGGLRSSLLTDFGNSVAKLELQVLGLIGKLFSGPWMKTFYTSTDSEITHIEGIGVVKDVLKCIKLQEKNPASVLTVETDFFGNILKKENDSILSVLQDEPSDKTLFSEMVKVCLQAIIGVLERQYEKYFSMDINEELKKQTQSARSHNIDAEEVMGMFSAAQQKAQNATLCYISSKIRAQKNCVVEYLDSLDKDKQENVVRFAMAYARKQRDRNRTNQKDIMLEIKKRSSLRHEKKNMSELRKMEKKLKTIDPSSLAVAFPDVEVKILDDLKDILEGKVLGRDICHYWFDTDKTVKELYYGKIEKLRKNEITYRICYWDESGTFDDAESYNISKYALASDLLSSDLMLC